jgi:hypothetical protein
MREIDQDRGESASIFQKEADRFSTGGRYLEPAAQAMGALLAAAEVPGAAKGIVGGAKLGRKAIEATESVSTPPKLPNARAVETAEEQGIKNSIKAATSEEQDIQRALGKGPSEEVAAQPSKPSTAQSGHAPETNKVRAVESKSLRKATQASQSLGEQLQSVQKQIDELRDHPDVPALQRDLEYIRFWANRGRESEAQELLKSLRARVETAHLSRERGVFESVYETAEAPSERRPESGSSQIRDRPPGVTKSESTLWARVRAGEEPDVTGFENPPGDRLKIDPNYRPPGEDGLTNRELAQQGRAPYLRSGERVELHHRDQNPFGPLDEHSESFHQFVGADPEFHPEATDPGYESWRRSFAVFEGQRRSLGDIYRILRERYWQNRFN